MKFYYNKINQRLIMDFDIPISLLSDIYDDKLELSIHYDKNINYSPVRSNLLIFKNISKKYKYISNCDNKTIILMHNKENSVYTNLEKKIIINSFKYLEDTKTIENILFYLELHSYDITIEDNYIYLIKILKNIYETCDKSSKKDYFLENDTISESITKISYNFINNIRYIYKNYKKIYNLEVSFDKLFSTCYDIFKDDLKKINFDLKNNISQNMVLLIEFLDNILYIYDKYNINFVDEINKALILTNEEDIENIEKNKNTIEKFEIFNKNIPISGEILFLFSKNNLYTKIVKIEEAQDQSIKAFIDKKYANIYNVLGYFIENDKKYRAYVWLDEKVKQNCKILHNKLSKYPFEEEIRPFGTYYLDIIFDIKQNYANKYNYCIKTDIYHAFPSIDIPLMFEYLIQDKFIQDNLTSDELEYIKNIYSHKFYYKKYILYSKKPELYIGIPTSTILFQIFMNIIIKNIKKYVKNLKLIVFMDDILIFDNDYQNIKKTLYLIKYVLGNYKLILNKEKTKFVNLWSDSLIFLNRIVVSNKDPEEEKYLEKYITSDNNLKIFENIDNILFMNLDKHNFNNSETLRTIQNLLYNI